MPVMVDRPLSSRQGPIRPSRTFVREGLPGWLPGRPRDVRTGMATMTKESRNGCDRWHNGRMKTPSDEEHAIADLRISSTQLAFVPRDGSPDIAAD